MALCMILGYANNFLLAIGLSSTMVGIVLALGNVLATVCQPILATYVDKTHADVNKIVIYCAAIVAILAVLLVILARISFVGAVLFVILFGLLSSLMPLLNAMAFAFESHGISLNYGFARGIGSAIWAITSWGVGRLLMVFSPRLMPLFYAVVLVGMIPIVRSFRMKDEDIVTSESREVIDVSVDEEETTAIVKVETEDIPEKTGTFTFFKKYKKFFLFLLGLIFVYMDHTIINNFFFNVVSRIGGNASTQGNALFIAAIVELPAMLLFDQFKEKIDITTLLKLSAIMFSVKHVLTWIAPNIMIIYVAQALQFFAYAIYIPASVYYVNALFDKGDAVKGQSIATMSMTIAGVLAALTGGAMIDALGVQMTLFVGALISITGTAIMLISTEKV